MSGGGNTDDTTGAQPHADNTKDAASFSSPGTAAPAAGGSVVSASAPSFSHLNDKTDAIPTADGQSEKANSTAVESASASPFPVFKRRATSFNDRLPLRSPASSARTAVATAFASVSSATTGRLAKFRSLSSDNFMKKNNSSSGTSVRAPTSAPTTASGSAAPQNSSRNAWKANMNDFARRAKEAAKRAKSGTRYSWGAEGGNAVQFVSGTFEYHGEDAGAVSSYFHIVADGVSSPFGRNSLAQITHKPVSSELIAKELVLAVQLALRDVTNNNISAIDLKILESVVVDAIKATRIKCFPHRQSRIAATLSVSYFDRWNGKLLTFSLGDSKCVVVRNGEIVFETPAVLRDFNMPTVVNLSHQVASSDYVLQSFALQKNDVCMTFSDGIGDNLYKDDITSAVKHYLIDGLAADAALQKLCDELVFQSQMKVSVERALELIATNDLDKLHDLQEYNSQKPDCENEHPNSSSSTAHSSSAARISIHSAPVRGLAPFATAAALEYRARALEECSPLPVDSTSDSSKVAAQAVDHLACSLAMFEKHKHNQTLGRHEMVRKPSQNRKRHYNLFQLKRMAEMQTKKPDDITLFISHFR